MKSCKTKPLSLKTHFVFFQSLPVTRPWRGTAVRTGLAGRTAPTTASVPLARAWHAGIAHCTATRPRQRVTRVSFVARTATAPARDAPPGAEGNPHARRTFTAARRAHRPLSVLSALTPQRTGESHCDSLRRPPRAPRAPSPLREAGVTAAGFDCTVGVVDVLRRTSRPPAATFS